MVQEYADNINDNHTPCHPIPGATGRFLWRAESRVPSRDA